MNAFQIQQSLAGMPYVSIPWIQREFGLTYSQAKTFLAQLQLRGWADRKVQGNRYAVRKENLRLRFLDRSEVDDLIMDISKDCGSVLRLLKKGKCVTFSEINDDINDDEDTARAIAILVKHKLIYLVDDVYFSCVSDKALEALGAVSRAKRYGRYGREESMDLEKMMQMREYFDILFEDD